MSNATSQETTRRWHQRATSVLSFAELAAPAREDDFSALSAEAIPDPEGELEARVTALLDESEAAAPGDSGAAGIPILLGNLEVAGALLDASQDPDDLFSGMGIETGPVTFDEARVQLAVLAEAADGTVEAPKVELPKAVADKFDELQSAGGTELVALAKSPTVHGAVVGGAKAITVIAGERAKEAFEAVREGLKWLRRQAVRIMEWVVARLLKLVPESFRDRFDELVDGVKERLEDGAPKLVGEALGKLLGRASATKAWQTLSAERSAELESRLDETTRGHLARIGYVASARKVVDKYDIVAAGLSAANLAPQVRAVALCLVGAVIGFVGYQVYDGFHDLEALAGS